MRRSIDVGRLLCVGVRGCSPDDPLLHSDLAACEAAGVGGVILFDVDLPARARRIARSESRAAADADSPRNIISPQQLQRLTGYIKKHLGDQVLICLDQEGGKTSRLSAQRGFDPGPDAAAFAAMPEPERRAEADGQAAQLAAAGIDVNLAPCVDLLLDRGSPIIAGHGRSFGTNTETVIENARIVLDALAAHGIAACLKHFPGHGSASGDSHAGPVDITHTHHTNELTPYRDLLRQCEPTPAVMVAHLLHRTLDPDRPASLSPPIIDSLLRRELGFDGVVVTDSIDMAAIADRWSPGDAAIHAVRAGVDFIVHGFNLRHHDGPHPALDMVSALRDAHGRGDLPTSRLKNSLDRLDRWGTTARKNRSKTDQTRR